MSILIDTSVWSLALRRQERDLNPEEQRIGSELRHLIPKWRQEAEENFRKRRAQPK